MTFNTITEVGHSQVSPKSGLDGSREIVEFVFVGMEDTSRGGNAGIQVVQKASFERIVLKVLKLAC